MFLNTLHAIRGCDGSFCENPEGQPAFPLDDMPDVHFCKICWSQEMLRRKKSRQGMISQFPGNKDVYKNISSDLICPKFDGGNVEKIRRTTHFSEE